MKRNQVKLHDNIVVLMQEKEEAAKDRKAMMDLIAELRDEVKILNLKRRMETVSVGHMFPVENQKQILDFMDNSDGKFQARCNGFYEYLFAVRAPTKKKFKENLKTHLFSDNYTATHHWPNLV